MGIEAIAGIAVTAILAVVGWIWKLSGRLAAADGRIKAVETASAAVTDRAAALSKELADHKEHVAAEYVSRETLKEFTDAVNRLGDRFDTFLMHFVPKP